MEYKIEEVKYPQKSWLKLFHFIPILKNQANAIVSKYDLINTEYINLNNGTKRIIIKTDIIVEDKKITILLVHLVLGIRTRTKQIKQLIEVVNNLDNPIILMGDFNTFKGSKEIEELLRKTDLKYQNGILENNKNKENKYTQPAYKPSKILDYILISDKINVLNYKILDAELSDHLPVYVECEV